MVERMMDNEKVTEDSTGVPDGEHYGGVVVGICHGERSRRCKGDVEHCRHCFDMGIPDRF